AIAVAAATCVSLLVGLPSLTSSRGNYLLAASKRDQYLYVTGRLRALDLDPERPVVMLIGSSALRSALVSDDQFANLIEPAKSQQPQVFNLSVPGARMWDLITVADALPPKLPGVIVIAIGPKSLSGSNDDLERSLHKPRFGFASPGLDRDAAAHRIAV